VLSSSQLNLDENMVITMMEWSRLDMNIREDLQELDPQLAY
jgi:hypothetical protein